MRLETYFWGAIIIIHFNTSCKINKAYTNGQEGLETVYETHQLTTQADLFNADGSGGLHASINFSPIKNVGVFYDHKSALFQHQYHTIGLGYYICDYKELELVHPSVSKSRIDIGRHLDFYGGMSYGFTKNSLIPTGTNFNSFPQIINKYELNYQGRRYFAQVGGHVKAKYISFDAVLRSIWLDPSKIETFGIGPGNDINALSSFTNPGYRRYTEFSFKMNFIGFYKPIYLGFTTGFGKETAFTEGAFTSQVVFLGANMDIYHLFTKKMD